MTNSVTLTLTTSEASDTLMILRDFKRDGCYWGNREQFAKRQDAVIAKVEAAFASLQSADTERRTR